MQECISLLSLKLAAGKPPEPAGWKPALRSAAILAAGSGGFPAASFKKSDEMLPARRGPVVFA